MAQGGGSAAARSQEREDRAQAAAFGAEGQGASGDECTRVPKDVRAAGVHDLLDADSHYDYMWRWMQLNPDWSMEEMNTDERREFNQQRAHVTSLLRRCFPELIERVNALKADKVRRKKEKRKAKREQQKQARDAWLVRSNARAGTRTRPTFCSSAPTCSWSTPGAAL